MAPLVVGPHITEFFANGTASDAVYGPGDMMMLRFSNATDRAPALWAPSQPGSLPQAAVSQLLACHVDVDGVARTVPLGVVTGEWLADDLLRLTVQSTEGAAPALLERGVPSAVGVGVLRCCVLAAANLRAELGLSLPVESCSAVLEGHWGTLPGPRIASASLSDTHAISPTLGAGATLTLRFASDTDMGGAQPGWPLDAATLEAGLLWSWTPFSAAEARWTDNRTLSLRVLAPLAPGSNATASAPTACGGTLNVSLRPVLGVRDAARLSLPSDATVTFGPDGCDAGGADGLYAWGNAVHPLGVAESSHCAQLRSIVAAPQPVPAFEGKEVTALAAAKAFSVALLADGSASAWGSELLGLATVASPQSLLLSGVAALSAGWEHALLQMDDGVLRGFGRDTHGQLGGALDGPPEVSEVMPQLIRFPGFADGLPAVRTVAAGAQHSLVVAADGGVYAFGLNDAAQLGPAADAGADEVGAYEWEQPRLLAAGWLAGDRVAALAAGRYHSLALLSDGAVCAWGSNARGQIGDGSALGATTHNRSAAPCFNLSHFAPTAAPAVAIAAGDEHSLAITRDGELFAWGKGTAALGVVDDVATPTRVALPSALGGAAGGAFVRSAAGGAAHSLAATASGEVWAWGAHGLGQLGIGCGALGGAAARPPALVASPMRGSLSAWRTVPAHGLAASAPLTTLELGRPPPSAPPPPTAPLSLSLPPPTAPLSLSPPPPTAPTAWLMPPPSHGGLAAACRAVCEADARCGGFELAPTADSKAAAAVAVAVPRDCTFYNASAADVFASAVYNASRPNASLHLLERVSHGGAAIVAAGSTHSLAAAGLTQAGRCPHTGEAQAECGGAARGACAWTECRCLAPWLGDGCSAQGCEPGCTGSGHGKCVLAGREGSVAQYACVCDAAWSGASCDTPRCAELDGRPCAGHGSCQAATAAAMAHQCVCDAGWYGAACSLPLCSGSALGGCTGHGTCKCLRGGMMLSECAADANGTEVQVCACEPGWVGTACGLACPVTASGAVCGGRGTCGLSDGGEARCVCDELWSGAACEQPLCAGEPDECGGSAHGTCRHTFDVGGDAIGASCVCAAGWSGADCGAMECEGGCSGHGTCELGAAGVPGCSCDDGWGGTDCSDSEGQRTLLYALSLGGGGVLLMLCICGVLRCLHALSTNGLNGPGELIMRQRWQSAHATSGPGTMPVHVPVRGVKTRISPHL